MRGLILAFMATMLVGCAPVQDAQVVGRWTAVKTDLRAGVGVTIDMDIRADKTVEIDHVQVRCPRRFGIDQGNLETVGL